jgi:hypothetical protein
VVLLAARATLPFTSLVKFDAVHSLLDYTSTEPKIMAHVKHFLMTLLVVMATLYSTAAIAWLTRYNAAYDATIVYVHSSLAELSTVAATQNKALLSQQFAGLQHSVDTDTSIGGRSCTAYLDCLAPFCAAAEAEISNFSATAPSSSNTVCQLCCC